MSGEPQVWAVNATGFPLEGPKKRLIDDLEYQFVTTKRHPDRHPDRSWRVKKGSGMGMKNSGEFFDAPFAKLVETWCLLPEVMSAFSIDLYGRCEDDIFIVAWDRKLTKHHVWGTTRLKKNVGYFTGYSARRRFHKQRVCVNLWDTTAHIATHRGPPPASSCTAL